MSDYCDFYYTPLKDKISVASKEFKCCECKSPILKNMAYWLYQGISTDDGSLSTFHQHVECRQACYLISQKDECIPFEGLGDHLAEMILGQVPEYIRKASELFQRGKKASKLKKEDLAFYNFSICEEFK